jgi:hypothetical protein
VVPIPDRPTQAQLEAARPKLVEAIIARAKRFAEHPHEGYEAGCYLRQKARIKPERGSQITSPPSGRSDELAWLYGVAEQEVLLAYYSWQVIEGADGTYELVLTLR